MKHFFRILLLVMLCLGLTGCERKKQESVSKEDQQELQQLESKIIDSDTEEIIDDVSSTANIPPKKSIITSHKFERQLLNEDSTIALLRGEYTYPQVENVESYPSVDKMNEEIKDNTEKQFVKSFTEGASYVKDFYGKEGSSSSSLPFVTEQKFEVTHNQDYIVSFKITSYDDFGGAHPNILQDAYTYDVRTGEQLPASHFVKGTDEDVKNLVSQSFYTVVMEQPDAFYPNAKEILTNGEFEFGFYVRDDSITFFINPYIIAPYAGGIQEINILLR